MKQYLDLLRHVLEKGSRKTDRTGTGTLSVFGAQMRFDLSQGFPLVTTKKVFWKGVVEELLWMIRGETNVKSLQEKGVHIWDEWADENGELGAIYGAQWRRWETTDPTQPVTQKYSDTDIDVAYMPMYLDQFSDALRMLKETPDSRRIIVSAWNPAELHFMALPPCHMLFQFAVYDGKLSCAMVQRSGDMFLGIPFNIASYSLLTHMVAQECGLGVGEFIHTIHDAHIYLNHIDQVKEQLTREPRTLPTLRLNPAIKRVVDFKSEDILLSGYQPHPAIKAPVSV